MFASAAVSLTLHVLGALQATGDVPAEQPYPVVDQSADQNHFLYAPMMRPQTEQEIQEDEEAARIARLTEEAVAKQMKVIIEQMAREATEKKTKSEPEVLPAKKLKRSSRRAPATSPLASPRAIAVGRS